MFFERIEILIERLKISIERKKYRLNWCKFSLNVVVLRYIADYQREIYLLVF